MKVISDPPVTCCVVCQDAFLEVDTEGNGAISLEELRTVRSCCQGIANPIYLSIFHWRVCLFSLSELCAGRYRTQVSFGGATGARVVSVEETPCPVGLNSVPSPSLLL